MRKPNSHNSRQKGLSLLFKFSFFIILSWGLIIFLFYRSKYQKPQDGKSKNSKSLLHLSSPNLNNFKLKNSNEKKEMILNKLNTEDKFPKSPDDKIHIVFSTDCSFFQDWQSLLVFHSATTIGQKGTVSRIASGCSESKKKELVDLYRVLYPRYSVHFTPDFKKDAKTNKKYDFYNKPYGVYHWLSNSDPPIPDGTIVVLIDPDMIFLRPITVDFHDNPANLFKTKNLRENQNLKLGKGNPVAQLYGLGAPWASSRNKNFKRDKICGPGSPCLKVEQHFGEDHFSVGPPYIVEKDDMLKLSKSWTEFVPKVYEQYPYLLAEMFAYSMAAAHTELPHLTMRSLMVSNIDMDEEGWKWIDNLQDDVCQSSQNGQFYPNRPMPTVLHYCQFYRAGDIGFHKRRIRKQIFECDYPMMMDIPKDLVKVDFKNRDGEIVKLTPKQVKRGTFMLCTIHKSINSMLLYYKSKMCPKGSFINANETINMVAKGFKW